MSFRTVGFGFWSLLIAFAAASCGGSSGDDDGIDETGGTGGTTGGSSTGGSATGGSATGGSATGGSATGGSATGGTGGDNCMPNPMAQLCTGAPPNMHMPPDGLLINWETYVVGSGNWGDMAVGDLTGGTSKYNGRMVTPITVTLSGADLHMTATIPQYTPNAADDAENYAGLVFWFGPCINASEFGGVEFTVGGTMNGAALKLQVQTAENYPADPANTKGACLFTDCATRWSECKGPDTTVTVPATAETVSLPWASFTAGSPNAEVDPTGLVGLQFQLECQSQDAACAVDITLGDITLTPP